MKAKLKSILKFLGTFTLCFIVIYLVVFSGGWKLFQSNDPILIELGVALILSIFVFAINEVLTKQNEKIKSLEERIVELERTYKY
jgi:low affinity Fe/Cu permease